MPTLKVNDIEIYYEEHGAGDVILMKAILDCRF
jgi:hypothetical protein